MPESPAAQVQTKVKRKQTEEVVVVPARFMRLLDVPATDTQPPDGAAKDADASTHSLSHNVKH